MDIIEGRYMLVTSGSERVIIQGADKMNLSNNQELFFTGDRFLYPPDLTV